MAEHLWPIEFLDKIVISESLYIGYSLLEHYLRDLPRLFRSLNIIIVRRIILSSFVIIWENELFC